jgi:acetate kinase
MEKAEQRKQAMQAIESEQNRIRQVYGDSAFDFWGEYNSNPEFRDLMDRKLPMETAYKVVNQQRMIENASKQAAANASKAVTNNILANGMRPVEGGIKTQPAVSTAIDVNNIKSLADIEKLYEMHGKRRS